MRSVTFVSTWGPALLLLFLSGCASWLPDPMRVEVQQGNVLSGDKINQLTPGLSRARVRELIGEPALASSFHVDRWDYVYYKTEAGRDPEPERLTLFFDGDSLARVVNQYQPPEDPLADRAESPLPETPSPSRPPTGSGPTSPTPGSLDDG